MFRSRNQSTSQKIKNMLWPKKGFQRPLIYLRERISRMSASTHALALGIACGAAASMTPFIGFHFFIAALLAYLIGGNLFTSAIGTIIGNPWSFPFIWAADAYLGNLIVSQFGLDLWLTNFASTIESDMPVVFFYKIVMGGLALAVIMFPIAYGLSYWGIHSWRGHRLKKRELKASLKAQPKDPIAPSTHAPIDAVRLSQNQKNPSVTEEMNS